jgi:hypothetical protein
MRSRPDGRFSPTSSSSCIRVAARPTRCQACRARLLKTRKSSVCAPS